MWSRIAALRSRRCLPVAVVSMAAIAAIAANACGSASTSLVQPSGNKCSYSVTNNTPEVPASGGSGTLTVATSRDCAWSASAEAPWITLKATSGQGPAALNYAVLPNPSGTARRGRVTVAEQTVDIAQVAAPCRYDLSPSTANLEAAGGQLSINVASPDGCSWTARSGAPWIGDPVPASGAGTATVSIVVGPNSTEARSGSVTIGNAAVRINQSAGQSPIPAPGAPAPAPTCTYRLTGTMRIVGREAQEFTVGLSAPAGCTWSAVSDVPWITVVEGQSGSGNGNVRISVGANNGSARTGIVRIGTETFTVEQAGATCTYSIKPARYDAGRGPDDILVNVTAPNGCEWTTATDVSWITIVSGAGGSGSGTVHLAIPANSGPSRTAVVMIAGQTFTVQQEGGCTTKIKPKNYHAGRGPDDIVIAVSADPGCSWTASSTVSWVTVAEGARGSGDGRVRLLVEANPAPARSVTLTIAGQPFDLRQDGAQ